MANTKKDPALDHVLFVRGNYGSTYEKRGAGGLDLLLLAGVPEPIANIDPDYLPALLADKVVVLCTDKGRTEDGKLHPSMKAPVDVATHDASVAQAVTEREALESGDTLPATPVLAATLADAPVDIVTVPVADKAAKGTAAEG